jgi:hypothetical protein
MGYRMDDSFVAPEHPSHKRRWYLEIEVDDAMSWKDMFTYGMKKSIV